MASARKLLDLVVNRSSRSTLCRTNDTLTKRWSQSKTFQNVSAPKLKLVDPPIQLPHQVIHRTHQSMCTEATATDPKEDNPNTKINGNENVPKKGEELKLAQEFRAKNFLHKVMRENKKWCHEHGFTDFVDVTEYSFLDKQTPVGTVLSCCDSRAPTAALGNDAPNEIFS